MIAVSEKMALRIFESIVFLCKGGKMQVKYKKSKYQKNE